MISVLAMLGRTLDIRLTYLPRRSLRVVHLELDPSLDQATRDLLEHGRLRATRAKLDGCRPVAGACEHGLGCGLFEKDKLRLDTDEDRDPRSVLGFPGQTELALVLPSSSRSEANTENRDKVQEHSMESAIGR